MPSDIKSLLFNVFFSNVCTSLVFPFLTSTITYLHDSLSGLQSCGATFPTFPYATFAYLILGGVGAGGGYYIGDTYFTSNSTNITQSNGTIFDTTNASKLFSIPFNDPVSYEVKTEYEDMLVYGLVLSIGLALIIVAFITYKNRQKISRRFEYESI